MTAVAILFIFVPQIHTGIWKAVLVLILLCCSTLEIVAEIVEHRAGPAAPGAAEEGSSPIPARTRELVREAAPLDLPVNEGEPGQEPVSYRVREHESVVHGRKAGETFMAFPTPQIAILVESGHIEPADRPRAATMADVNAAIAENERRKQEREDLKRQALDKMMALAAKGKGAYADHLQALLDEGVRLSKTYSPFPMGFGASTGVDVKRWIASVEQALAGRPRDLSAFRFERRSPLGAMSPLAGVRGDLDYKLRELERVINAVRGGK